tara:strand:- start:424 stop:1608 length:1185 start_codon:yes stop_codon:yes gene_type:complete
MSDSEKSAEDVSKIYDYYNSDFNASKYFVDNKVVVGPAEKVTYYVDGSDAYANLNKLFVSFQHAATGKSVFFKAFITAFNEAYSSDWTSESVYGRADPIYMFKQTQRKITLALKIPAASVSEGYENLGRIQMLTQFLYPNYETVSSAQTISQSPLVRLKVMNLLRNTNDAMTDQKVYGSDRLQAAGQVETDNRLADYGNLQRWHSHDGLLGVIENLTVNHNLEGDDGSFVVGKGTVLPKFIDINLSFAPIHEHPLGWTKGTDGKYYFGMHTKENAAGGSDPHGRLFPYGVNIDDPLELYGEADEAAQGVVQQAIEDGQSQTAAREANEAVIASAEARYAGLIGTMRLKKDLEAGEQAAQDYAQEQFLAGEYTKDGEYTRQGQKIEDAYKKGGYE